MFGLFQTVFNNKKELLRTQFYKTTTYYCSPQKKQKKL